MTNDQNNQRIVYTGKDVPLGAKPNQVSDVADTLLFVGSDDAQMMTGQTTVVDGGQSLTTNRQDDYLYWLKDPARIV